MKISRMFAASALAAGLAVTATGGAAFAADTTEAPVWTSVPADAPTVPAKPSLDLASLEAVKTSVPKDAPSVPEKPSLDLGSLTGKKTPKDESEQADLVGKRLDNAKKGIEAAKSIVDTLTGIGGLFGFGGN
ncbi:hypothetical protein [Corynebacterium bovis]|uniref:hypothetical protein n=1 Tax=Corynebacterium bovis TaxID=36808 RepID=UPI003139D4AC